MGFTQGVASPCCFYHAEWKVQVVVHGDDFSALGTSASLTKFEAGIQHKFEVKLKGRLGTGPDDLKEMRVLNRIIRVTQSGLLYEPNPRHIEMLTRDLNLGDCNFRVTPGEKTNPEIDFEPAELEDPLGAVNSIYPRKTKIRFNDTVGSYDVPA